MEQENTTKRKRGRPKGSKDKIKTTPINDGIKQKRGRPAKTPLDYRKQLFSNARYERLYNLISKYTFMTYGNLLEQVSSTNLIGEEEVKRFAGKFFDIALRADLLLYRLIEVERDDGGVDGAFGFCFIEFRLVSLKIASKHNNRN